MWTIRKEELQSKLQIIAGVVGRKQTLPILSNILWQVKEGCLRLTATDTEIELASQVILESGQDVDAITTIPGKKLIDIVRSSPNDSKIQFELKENSVVVRYEKNRFLLATLSADQFPTIDTVISQDEFSVTQSDLQWLIERTHFSMAQQDVRYYLNGMVLQLGDQAIKATTSDGHRLSCAQKEQKELASEEKILLPRKAVMEMNRLLLSSDEKITIRTDKNYLQLVTQSYSLTTKLIEGKIPDYQKILSNEVHLTVHVDKEDFKQALSRAAILCNLNDHGVRLRFSAGKLTVLTHNSGQESAEIEIPADYTGHDFEIVFNVMYLLEGISVFNQRTVKLSLKDPSSGMMMEEVEGGESWYVVMPICT